MKRVLPLFLFLCALGFIPPQSGSLVQWCALAHERRAPVEEGGIRDLLVIKAAAYRQGIICLPEPPAPLLDEKTRIHSEIAGEPPGGEAYAKRRRTAEDRPMEFLILLHLLTRKR
ncbi:MAG: hypothetical protein AB1805_05950 [Nitrospirota bacterium]